MEVEKIQKNQIIPKPGKLGGARPGAGRPKGINDNRYKITDFMSEQDIKDIIKKAKEKALAGNTQMLKLLIEQAVGKAAAQIDISTLGKKVDFMSPKIETALIHLFSNHE